MTPVGLFLITRNAGGMLWLQRLTLTLIACLTCSAAVQAETIAGRSALVVVQRDYPNAAPSANIEPLVDALKKSGFDVRVERDIESGKAFRSVMDDFSRSVPTVGTAVVYVSGLGTSYERSGEHNVIMPTKANWKGANEVRVDCISADHISESLKKSGAARGFIFFDAPLENPLAPQGFKTRGFKAAKPKSGDAIILSHEPLAGPLADALPKLQGDRGAWLDSLKKQLPEAIVSKGLGGSIPPFDDSVNWIRGPLREGERAGDHWVNRFGMVFVWCPAGSFRMGIPDATSPGSEDAVPVDVTLSKGFWIAKYELTQREFQTTRGRDSKGTPTIHKNAPTTNAGTGDTHMFKKIHELESKTGMED